MKKIIKKFEQLYKQIKYISVQLAIYEFLSSIIGIYGNSNIYKRINFKKHEIVKNYIRKSYKETIYKYYDKSNKCLKIKKDCTIWIFWWQGENNAPQIVKMCINSVKRNMPSHEVIVIDKHNIENYITIPIEIKSKLKSGDLSITGFSDYVRFSLLANYSGLWLDSTVFLTDNFDDLLNNYSFFTIKHGLDREYHVCKGLWMVSVLGCGYNSKLFEFCKELMENILVNEPFNITYLLVDCIIAIAYEEYKDVREQINVLPNNNSEFISLDHYLINGTNILPETFFEKQKIHKLSYKAKYKENLLKEMDIFKYYIKENNIG